MRHLDEPAAVDVAFDPDGHPHIRRFRHGESWVTVAAQGRTWLDETGRHVLVMGPGSSSFELLLRSSDLTWRVLSIGPTTLLA